MKPAILSGEPWIRLRDTLLRAQPLLAAPIFFSILLGQPPLWLSWLVALTPVILRLQRDKRFIKSTPFDIPILIFVLGLLLGMLASANQPVSFGALHTLLACVLLYYGITNNSDAKNYYWFSLGGVVLVVILGLSFWFFSQGQARVLPFNAWAFKLADALPEIGGPTLNLHSLAALLAVVTPALLALAIFRGDLRLRLTGLVLGLLCTAILVLAASGSGWIAAALGLMLVIVFFKPWMAGAVVPLVGILTWLAVVNYDHIPWLIQVFSTTSFLDRVEYWGNTIDLLKASPITGLGLGSYFEIYNSSYVTANSPLVVNAHNSYLQLYSDTGFLGLVALIWSAVVMARSSRRILLSSKQSCWYGVGVGIIGGIVAGATQAVVEVTTTGTIVNSPTSYLYIGIPLVWVWAALFSVASAKLTAKPLKRQPYRR